MTGFSTSLADVSSGRRPRAPAPLALVQDLVNTTDLEAGTDRLTSVDELRSWLAAHGLPTGRLSAADLGRFVELREAIRDALGANAHRAATGATARLAAAARTAPLRLAAGPGGPKLEAMGSPVDRAIGAVLVAIAEATAAGLWPRLKVCRNDACRWAYWDASKNRSGVWCTMAVCGNRAKGARFRRRQGRAARGPA